MATLKSIKKRISTVKNSRQITKAMTMVAAAKLRRAQDKALSSRPYAEKLDSVIHRLATNGAVHDHPLLHMENVDVALLIVITADRGLCGSFNANICKEAERFIREKGPAWKELKVMTIGRKGHDYLRRRVSIFKSYTNILSDLNFHTAALIAREITEGFIAGEFGEVHLLYNAFKNVMTQDLTITRLLPIAPPLGEEEEYHPEPIYEPGKKELLSELLPKNIEIQVFHALLESISAEHGARMTAMDSATKNATKMIDKLTLQYNRARQAAITKELMEIIAGAESVKN